MTTYFENNNGPAATEQAGHDIASSTLLAGGIDEQETKKKSRARFRYRLRIAKALRKVRTADGMPKYEMIGGKPVIWIDAKTVLNDTSDKFHDKLLCDGLVLNAGDACPFSCTFCYVPAAMLKLHSELLNEFNRETGLDLSLSQVVIRRRNFLDVLKSQLLNADGSRIYDDANDQRVLYSSTLVDVAATMDILRETARACILILENTNWQIRLLSKSPLLARLVTHKLIPEKYHHRLILGFSTGTLDDGLAGAIEGGTGRVSMRIKALHQLQDLGIRTFAMICPSLPYGTQEEYDEFSRMMCEALRIEKCESVWAEVINLRGHSLQATAAALREGGYEVEAIRLEAVSGPGKKVAWEDYARMTFEAHAKHIPADKLRFLQYVKADTADYWCDKRQQGAVLLGSYAERNGLITHTTSAPSGPLPELGEDDFRFREEREQIVTRAIDGGIGASKALHEIKTYRGGLLWRKDFRSFEDYCLNRWGYQKSHAYRLVRTGGLIARLEDAGCAIGHNTNESHFRPLLAKVPEEHQVECWKSVTSKVQDTKLTASNIATGVTRYLKKEGIVSKPAKRPQPDPRELAKREFTKFKATLAKLAVPGRFGPLLHGIITEIEREPEVQADTPAAPTPESEPELAQQV